MIRRALVGFLWRAVCLMVGALLGLAGMALWIFL